MQVPASNLETRRQAAARRGVDEIDDHSDLQNGDAPAYLPEDGRGPPATATVSTADMMNICTKMMMLTQQFLQQMAKDKEERGRKEAEEER